MQTASAEEFLGGRPDPKDVKINSKGDIIIMKGNEKFRMDVKNPGDKPGPNGTRVPEEPHLHLQELKKNGKWGDATDGHRFYFKKGDIVE